MPIKSKLISFIQLCFLICGSIAAFLFIAFLVNFHFLSEGEKGQSVYTRSELGTLGDLLGGTLNPLLTFLTIGLLIWSIRIQQKELGEATKQSTRAADALTQSNDFHKSNVLEHKKATLIPFAMEKLKVESSNMYSHFKAKPKLTVNALANITATAQVGPITKTIILPSIADLAFTKASETKTSFLSSCDDKALAKLNFGRCLSEVREQLAICTQYILGVHSACKMLKEIGAPVLLYNEEFNQAEQLNILLNQLEEKLVKLGMQSRSFKLTELGEMEHLERPSLVNNNSDGTSKPFSFTNFS